MSTSKELLEKRGCYWCKYRKDGTCDNPNAWTEKGLKRIWKVGDVYYYVGDACSRFVEYKERVVFT